MATFLREIASLAAVALFITAATVIAPSLATQRAASVPAQFVEVQP